MPEREFELYLSLLSRFLRLQPAKRDEIADELRDHLDQRLEELAARGLSREQAIHKALEEFGDAAELAKHFTQAAHVRRRRLIMRCTYGTIAALAAALFIAPAFWPAAPENPMGRKAVAQNPGSLASAILVDEPANGQRRSAERVMTANENEKRIFATLDAPTDVSFAETTLEDAIKYVADYHRINVWIDKPTLTDEGVSLETPITLQLTGVTFRSTLKLLLAPQQLTYVIEDEVMKITSVSMGNSVIGVYDVRDLIANAAGGAAQGAEVSVEKALAAAATLASGQPNRPAVRSKTTPAPYETTSIAELVAQTIAPRTWSVAGGEGLVMQYDGLLVVRNSQPVHDKVASFIKLLRSAKADFGK